MPATPATELTLIEIFSSLQGEGVLIGRRQLFVRLAGCNLRCAYCDTPYTPGPTWRVEAAPGADREEIYSNPAALQIVTNVVKDLQSRWPVHHSLALTGGEPLLQASALAEWLPFVKSVLPVYLETNGMLPEALASVLRHVDWVSMDVKLAATTGEPTPWEAHAAFLEIAREKTCQIKAVVDGKVGEEELAVLAAFVRRHGAGIPLVLQPRMHAGRPVLAGRRLLALHEFAARAYPDTLLIPQLHPLLSIR